MEIDITHMVDNADEMIELSGSEMEHGPDAGRITWDNSKAYAAARPLLTNDDMRDAARAHFKEYGAWSEEEIAAWSEEDLQAFVCQDVAAAIRETISSYAGDGESSGCLYKGDNGHWYFYLGT